MFNLVLSVISIALVIGLALTSVFYGGDLFSKASAKITAAQVMNQMQQIDAAFQLYLVEGGVGHVGLPNEEIPGIGPVAPSIGYFMEEVPEFHNFLETAPVPPASLFETGMPLDYVGAYRFDSTNVQIGQAPVVGLLGIEDSVCSAFNNIGSFGDRVVSYSEFLARQELNTLPGSWCFFLAQDLGTGEFVMEPVPSELQAAYETALSRLAADPAFSYVERPYDENTDFKINQLGYGPRYEQN